MIFLAAMLWPRPRHPRVGRVLGCEDFDEDVDKDVDEDFDKDVDEDIDEDEDVIEDVGWMRVPTMLMNMNTWRPSEPRLRPRPSKLRLRPRPSKLLPRPRHPKVGRVLGCDLSSMTEIVPLLLPHSIFGSRKTFLGITERLWLSSSKNL